MNQQPPQTPTQGFALPQPVSQGGVLPPPPAAPPSLPGYMPLQQPYDPHNPGMMPQPPMPQTAPYYPPQQPLAQAQQPYQSSAPAPTDLPVQPAPMSQDMTQPVISMPPGPIQVPYVPEVMQAHEKQIETERNDANIATAENENAEHIDQEWIQKAKEVIDKTHSDPYQESLQLNQVKTAYLKARYNKTIKAQKT